MDRKNTRINYLVAPTCAGKGYSLAFLDLLVRRQIAKGRFRIGTISFGEILRHLLKNDAEFAAKYGPIMAAGDLIDDPEAIRIFRAEIDRSHATSLPHLLMVDGFGRSVPQVAYVANNGLLTKDDTVFMINVSQEKCLERFLHRKAKANQARTDDELKTFYKRYHLHMQGVPDLRAILKDTDCKLIEIDGEPDIPTVVSPDLNSHLLDDIIWAAQIGSREAVAA